ncbi:MAG: hypothetical protein L0210_12540, partial [Rhodospirillales bacterium]|nr:hypothetical protein [Rhodospirillales bacterium]
MARRFGGVPVVMLGLMAWSAAAEPGKAESQPPGAATGASALDPANPTGAPAEDPGEGLLGSIAFAPRSVELNEAGQRSLEELA